ncbi:unnamed protein product [Closterium sp. NIES-53]
MADATVPPRLVSAQDAEDGEEDMEDEENTLDDYAHDRENDLEFDTTKEDLFQGGPYAPTILIEEVERSEGPGGDEVRRQPGEPVEEYKEDNVNGNEVLVPPSLGQRRRLGRMYGSSSRPSTVGELLDRLRRAAGDRCGVAVDQGARQLQLSGLGDGWAVDQEGQLD